MIGMDLGMVFNLGKCSICGSSSVSKYRLTCSDVCHEEYILRLEKRFGVYKKVVDVETGKTHKVPTRDILERGLRQQDLKHYPEFVQEESSLG